MSAGSDPVLSQGDLVITESDITAVGQRFSWGELGIVQIVKPKDWLA